MKKVMVFGTFDIFHKGHKNFLKQAKKHGDYLIVVIARDKTVLKIKNNLPKNTEKVRLNNINKTNIADMVVLGNQNNKLGKISEYKPDIICLGYDQNSFNKNLETDLLLLGLKNTKVIRLNPFKPEIYKSSKLKT